MILCKTIMLRMYLILFGFRSVYSLISMVLYRMTLLMVKNGYNIPKMLLFLGLFCTDFKIMNIFIFYVELCIRVILYIFIGQDLIVIMILLSVILLINFWYMSSALKYSEIQTFVVCVLLYMSMGSFCNVFFQQFLKDTFVFCDFIVRCIHCTLSVCRGWGGGRWVVLARRGDARSVSPSKPVSSLFQRHRKRKLFRWLIHSCKFVVIYTF